MLENESTLRLVVMYGFGAEEHWQRILGPDRELVRNHATRCSGDSTTFVYVQHPVWPPRKDRIPECLVKDSDWVKVAEEARRISDES
jgi:hypothetical protein